MRHIKTQTVLAGFMLVFLSAIGLPAAAGNDDHRCEDVELDLDSGRLEARVDEEFSYEVGVEGDSDSLEITDGELPEGLTFDEDEHEISGTPEEEGTFRIELTVENDCSDDTETLRIDVDEARDEDEAGVTVSSTLIRGDESYVYLSQIPYTGVGDTLRISLTILALMLWSGALAFIFVGEKERVHLRNLFFSLFSRRMARNESVIDRSVYTGKTTETNDAYGRIEEDASPEAALLQKLRGYAYEEKILMTEGALSMLVLRADTQDKEPSALLSEIVEEAKARYPREDGLIKIDTSRLTEIFEAPFYGNSAELGAAA